MRALALSLLLAAVWAPPVLAFDAVAGRSFYMDEIEARLLLTRLPPAAAAAADQATLFADVLHGDRLLARRAPVQRGRHDWVAFPLASLPQGDTELTCRLYSGRRPVGSAVATIRRLAPRANAVQVDRLGGGLVVDGLPWFPFGFYCYSPVQPTLAEEEAVRGFNLMSPYQSNDPATRAGRLAYMDRAAELGMKVHYQLLRVAGGGGVYGAGQDTSAARRQAWLRDEVEALRDHPALLAWYISDEPTGHGATPGQLRRAYETVRALDPYHPVSIVFLNPGAAARFAGAMDLAMVDPYPIPNGPPASVGQAVRTIDEALRPRLPVWLVPQAFGGNEHWTREPTGRELRLMTWLGIVEGATGVQYFIRHGLSGFPKSPATWAAASGAALEVAALTPLLLSGEAAPEVTADGVIRARAWRTGDELLIAAVNPDNRPRQLQLTVAGPFAGTFLGANEIEVLYEDRIVPLRSASRRGPVGLLMRPLHAVAELVGTEEDEADGLRLEDAIDAYGVRLYRLAAAAPESAEPDPSPNLLVDPSFEWDAAASVPAAIYADVGAGRGATAFVDARRAAHGRRSLRLVTPRAGEGVGIRPYAPAVTPGHTYRLSVWARARDGTSPVLRLHAFAAGDSADHVLTDRWQRYWMDGTVGPGATRAALGLQLATAGTAWIDRMAYRDISPRIRSQASPAGHTVTVESVVADADLHLRLDGSDAGPTDPVYAGPVRTTGSAAIRVALVREASVLARAALDLHHHDALSRFVDLAHPFSPRYAASGPGALTDGVLGSDHFNDGRWQGYEGEDLFAVIDLGRPVTIQAVACRFLQNAASWIWLPRVMEVNLSDDGRTFRPFATADHDLDERTMGAHVRELRATAAPDRARFVRLRARSVRACPDWHPGAGGPAWVFADEIRVNP